MLLFIEQVLNGLQLGFMLFLLSAGLTLVFGVMNLINLAHGSFYMVGAYVAATVMAATGSFALALLVALGAAALCGFLVEVIVLRHLYHRDHLDQVLATFGLILLFNETTRVIWGRQPLFMDIPEFLSTTVEILPGVPYPLYRLVIIAVGIGVAVGLYFLIRHTRLGMRIRAGASNREMIAALGVNIRWLYSLVFGLGAMLAGFAGVMAAPVFAVESGMGVSILSNATIQKELKLGTLAAVQIDPPIDRPFSFVHQKQKFRVRAMDELLSFARNYCRSHQDEPLG